MKKLFLLVLSLLLSNVITAQKTDKVWEALIKNDRETALKYDKKINNKKANTEWLILKQIIRNENGLLNKDPDFLPNFIKIKNFESYLSALWQTPYVFTNYLETGFNKKVIDNITFINQYTFKDKSLESNYRYLEAISARYQNDFNTYNSKLAEIQTIGTWQYCSVFENLNKSGMDIVYPPEKSAYSKKDYEANSNGKINWFTTDYAKKTQYQLMNNFSEYGSGINYAQTFLNLDKDQEFIFKLGFGSPIKIWINDIQIFEESENQATGFDAYIFKVKLHKGNNRILIKIANMAYSYFGLRIFDTNNQLINPNKLQFSTKNYTYTPSTKEELSVETIQNPTEKFIKNLDEKKYSKYFKNYLLINYYLQGKKVKQAKKIISKCLKKYPKSSFFRHYMLICANKENDKTLSNELIENRKKDDPNNYIVLYSNIINTKKLFNEPIEVMNEKIDKMSKSTDSELLILTGAFLKTLRKQDKIELKKILDQLYSYAKATKNAKLLTTYTKIYSSTFNDKEKTLKGYEEANKLYYYYPLQNKLIKIYKNLGKKEKILSILRKNTENAPELLNFKKDFINTLIDYQKYKEALKQIDEGLEMFPYSFILMEKKADILTQQKKEKEALKWYKKSYTHNSGDSDLRKKILDLKKRKDPIEKFAETKPYEYIKKTRGKTDGKNYDINILLDQLTTEVFEEGGYRTREITIYEVTSKEGIETLKEYNLGIGRYGNTINKTEIIKPDGKIVPAERSGSKLVFNSLSIGDVILLDYETSSNKSGRFYKDYYDRFIVESYYPILKSNYQLIIPKTKKIEKLVTKGNYKYTTKNIDDYILYAWKRKNIEALAPSEPFMPSTIDVATTLHVSSIKNWNHISNWYSDLVRSQIKYEPIVLETFHKIFPNGFENLTEQERAKKIYYYMTNNLTYSFVNFKQSGFIPQKPSKTIKTLLGDCKDFSTLFITLAKKANLKTNIVLVSTSDLGQNLIKLPSISFNHAIVKVILDGNEQYLELTNNQLDFASIPSTLEGALALNIPFNSDKNKPNNLYILNNLRKNITILKSEINYNISDNAQTLDIKVNSSGKINVSYRKLLSTKNENVLKKDLTSEFENKEDLDLSLISYKIIKNKKEDKNTVFSVLFNLNDKIKKLGKSKLIKLPNFYKPYTSNIINLEKRSYPIVYRDYESVDEYITDYTINIGKNHKFTEIPENEHFTYKNHDFTIKFVSPKDNILQVSINAKIDRRNISPEDYPTYKEFVQKILAVYDTFIGFK